MLIWNKPETDGDSELPDRVALAQPELSYQIWQLMEATGWKFPPSVLLKEPDWLIMDLLTITGQQNKITKVMATEKP